MLLVIRFFYLILFKHNLSIPKPHSFIYLSQISTLIPGGDGNDDSSSSQSPQDNSDIEPSSWSTSEAAKTWKNDLSGFKDFVDQQKTELFNEHDKQTEQAKKEWDKEYIDEQDYKQRLTDEDLILQDKLKELNNFFDDVHDSIINRLNSSPSGNEGSSRPSNLDDYADPSLEQPSYMDPED